MGTCVEKIQSDLWRYTQMNSLKSFLACYLKCRGFRYSLWLRLASHPSLVVRMLAARIHSFLSSAYSIYIPADTTIGYGLHLGHEMPLVVNNTCILGNNVNLSQFVSIGANLGKGATIGDNCYIGPSVCIVESVIIGSDCIIGAGAVVISDVPSGSTAVGVPAKILPRNNHTTFISNRWIVR